MELSAHHTVAEFFREALSTAIRNQHVDASADTEFYLVNLLSEFARAPLTDEPLALRLSAAVTALPEERAHKLREIGDQSLYVSGFFADSLQRSLVDVDYYIRIGGSAYGQLARMGACGRAAGPVFVELAGKFPQFVEVIAEVSAESTLSTERGIVDLYQRWQRTGSEWIERKLRARGVLPRRGPVQ